MRTPQQKIADYIHQRFLEEMELASAKAFAIGMSPIEDIFFSALWNVAKLEGPHEPAISDEPDLGVLGFVTQEKIEKFRVDFVITVRNRHSGSFKRMVVECDGHDFHERTKEQARKDRSRDRRLQELGFTVYRFTGAELYRDPVKCAQDVIRWAVASSEMRS